VPAAPPAQAPKKRPETLILQGFRGLPAVAKRGFSSYNMSYFNPALIQLGKRPSDTNFQVGKNRPFKFAREISSGRSRHHLQIRRRDISCCPQRGNSRDA